MASVSTSRNGTRAVLVICPDGKRRRIRLGRATKDVALEVKRHVEHLLAHRRHGLPLPGSTAEWIGNVTGRLRQRLAVCGLADAAPGAPTLAAWLSRYIEGRGDVAENTRLKYKAAEKELLDFFGAARPLDAIGPGDAEDFNVWLRTKRELSEGTARRRVGICKQFFTAALKRRLLRESPFAEITCGEFSEPRFAFVTPETAAAVMDALPTPAWRLTFALARWGGLRVPSEVTALTWADVSWDRSRFTVHSRKTARHDGKGSRVVPIFPELAGPFREAFEAAEAGDVHCCPQYPVNIANQMYRKIILQALARAGVEPWPKLFVNLRATRASELAERFPAHVAAAWLGHSPKIALKHYLMTTEDHFARASGATQKATQQEREMLKTPCNGHRGEGEKPAYHTIAGECTNLHTTLVGRAGVEPKIVRADSARVCASSPGQRGAKSGALAPDSGPSGPSSAPPASADSPPGEADGSDLPPDVADLARRLAALPENVRAKIVAMVKADERNVPPGRGTR